MLAWGIAKAKRKSSNGQMRTAHLSGGDWHELPAATVRIGSRLCENADTALKSALLRKICQVCAINGYRN